jgi:hypothetical protein
LSESSLTAGLFRAGALASPRAVCFVTISTLSSSVLAAALFAAVALGVPAAAGAPGAAPAVTAPLPRAGDVSLTRFVLVGQGSRPAPPKVTLAAKPPAGVGVFTWVGRDGSNRTRFDLLVAVVNAHATGKAPVGLSLAGGRYRATRTATVAGAIAPGRSLICNDIYDQRLSPQALVRGTVEDPAVSVFGSVCSLAADGPAPFDFVKSFGGFYCVTQFVNDPSYLDGVRWATSCTKPFSSASLDVGPGYELRGSRLAETHCQQAGQTLTCSSAAEVTTIDLILLLDPIPGDSPNGTATIRRADGEQLAGVQVVQYAGAHQHG